MSISVNLPRAASPSQQGRFARTLFRWLMRPACVAEIKTLSPRFRLIGLEGEALRDVAWKAGQKIQMAMNTGLAARTYTPISWDAERGRTRILAFAHGEGPASSWSSALRSGDACQFAGPRRSLDLAGLASPVVLFGDETAFGLAMTLRATLQGNCTCMFEVRESVESRAVLDAIGLDDATVIERVAYDAHLAAMSKKLAHLATGGAHFILTGRAPAIQHVSRALKAVGVGSSRLVAKAYWAPGKTGLE